MYHLACGCLSVTPGTWGFYDYPGADSGCGSACGVDYKTRFDDANLWLLCQTDALFPSIYLRSTNTTVNRANIDAELIETRRVRDVISQRCGRHLPIFTYTWAEYYVGLVVPWTQLLSAADVDIAFVHPVAAWGVAGTVLWGDGAQVRNRTLCGDGVHSLSAWVNNTMGPRVLQASKDADACAATRCSGHGSCWGAKAATGVQCDCDVGWTGTSCERKVLLHAEPTAASGGVDAKLL
jgi:hypothetical protein